MDYVSDIKMSRGSMWAPTGLSIMRLAARDGYGHCALRFSNLNPDVEFTRVVSRWDLVRLAAWSLFQAAR